MSGTFEVGASVPLRAFHRIPWGPDAEREPHAHDYRIDVTIERAGLDDRGVVVDLDVVNAALKEVTARLAGQDLDAVISPEDTEAVTVEILARWLHGALRDAVRRGGGEVLSVRVWESTDAFGGYREAVG
jgi:6-pyruvoyl-tetrahydropterin synthase